MTIIHNMCDHADLLAALDTKLSDSGYRTLEDWRDHDLLSSRTVFPELNTEMENKLFYTLASNMEKCEGLYLMRDLEDRSHTRLYLNQNGYEAIRDSLNLDPINPNANLMDYFAEYEPSSIHDELQNLVNALDSIQDGRINSSVQDILDITSSTSIEDIEKALAKEEPKQMSEADHQALINLLK